MLEQLYFNKQSQPLYVLVNADMVPYSEPLGYSPRKEVGEFVKWIENSLRELP